MVFGRGGLGRVTQSATSQLFEVRLAEKISSKTKLAMVCLQPLQVRVIIPLTIHLKNSFTYFMETYPMNAKTSRCTVLKLPKMVVT